MPCAYDAARGQDPAWHVNFLGHFILTQKLLPHMARGARVCNVTSEVYRFSYDSRDLPLDDVDDPTKYDAVKSYGQSKLAIVLWTCHQARSPALVERDVSMMLVHPGSVETTKAPREARRQSGWRGAVLHCIGAPFVKSLECGAATTVYAALHPRQRRTRSSGIDTLPVVTRARRRNKRAIATLRDASPNAPPSTSRRSTPRTNTSSTVH